MIFAVRQLVGAMAFGAVWVLSMSPSAAQSPETSFPAHPVTLVVPFAAGGQTDIIARVVGQVVTDELGQQIVVENRPGAGGAIGAAYVSRAAPDGYTLLAIDISFVALPNVQPKTGYSPADFRMVGPTSRGALGMIVAPRDPAKNLKEFIERSTTTKDEITFAHAGIGSTPHLAALSFVRATKIHPLMIPYGGMSPAMNDVAGDRVTSAFTGPALAAGMAKEHLLKLFAVTGERRVDSAPDVPTFSELGITLPGFEKGTWYGIAVPSKTPDSIVAKLNAALQRGLARSEVGSKLQKSDVYPWAASQGDFDTFVREQADLWKAQLAGIQP
jgi:tripartite-type tricarboxylate transporter receptor subunit TctC